MCARTRRTDDRVGIQEPKTRSLLYKEPKGRAVLYNLRCQKFPDSVNLTGNDDGQHQRGTDLVETCYPWIRGESIYSRIHVIDIADETVL